MAGKESMTQHVITLIFGSFYTIKRTQKPSTPTWFLPRRVPEKPSTPSPKIRYPKIRKL